MVVEMLTTLRLINFKSFENQELQIKPMTLLAGLNNTGKSSVIQAIRMLNKWVRKGDPALEGHGILKYLIKSYSVYPGIKLEYFFNKDKAYDIIMDITFNQFEEPIINSPRPSLSQIPFISYVSADRFGPKVFLPLFTSTEALTYTGTHGEYVLDYLSRNERAIVPPMLIHPKSEGKTLIYNVRAWLTEIAPGVDFKYNIETKNDTSYFKINDFRPTNSGFGLSYALPVIISLLGMASQWVDNNEGQQSHKESVGAIVLLENPEAHLHPKGQTSMGRFIALAAASGVQVVVETHSEHIMDGIRIAVKNGELMADKTVFHYLSLDENKTTKVDTPILYPNGKLSFWPEGFFDQSMINSSILARKK
ncbi:MAG: DUF3696 domain-containing protein [Candidatus Magnetoovum sp. WYHC-5]|nr:DUF3696 domain-containing protein [Candidatus Magnetoovum sp. WYHC-5]